MQTLAVAATGCLLLTVAGCHNVHGTATWSNGYAILEFGPFTVDCENGAKWYHPRQCNQSQGSFGIAMKTVTNPDGSTEEVF